MGTVNLIRERLEVVRGHVTEALNGSGRGADEVRILVASKYYAPEQMAALAGAGVELLGENKAEDLLRKQEEFGDAFEWHFIGHLQRRKAKDVVTRVALIHSVDSVRLVNELAKRAPEGGVEILVQVNASGEESKYGVEESEVEPLLEAARPRSGALEVLLHAADGYTDTFAFDKAMDPTTMVVYRMNGEPLPQRHGFPARVVVPGLYGEKNVKWVTGIEVVDHDAKGFYEEQGWGPNFEIPTRSDIFAPRWSRGGGDVFAEPFPLDRPATIRGRAFAGARGVAGVEFSADDGQTWSEARIDYPGTDLTWSFWSFEWRPETAGETVLLTRATDGTGAVQSPERRGIIPQGATGYHRVLARVEG